MSKKEKKKGKLKQKLTDKYRLVVLNEDTFEERFSLKLSRLNVFVFGGIFSILLITATILLIAFTPIRDYIPGHSSTALKIKTAKLNFTTDSLKLKIAYLENYTKALLPVLTGEISAEAIDSLAPEQRQQNIDENLLNASKEDSIFREKVESETLFSLQKKQPTNVSIVFFAPLNGTITQNFESNSKHFAVDIAAKKGDPVKATADGTVIFSGWTTETGYVIIIKHAKEYLSVYKHNGNLLKEQGDFVKSGEVIATVGSTGELTTGEHLHFELWNGGYAVNPLNFIDFK
ncbi:M23 family metallopeptidase [uncultured Polaribacter sp.]|uniref:M23 family metallopeptidase n=1 Tax=uncultured Polaribacter sp. TaxID=174711 RepID=UPI00261821EF|nr:M23 family metallopeptidase [uncultured Polaribacter sp.]